jgi:4'-phosphopantetheinyl transferase
MQRGEPRLMIWNTPVDEVALAPLEVHLWLVHLVQPDDVIQACRVLLDSEERARADRFYFDRDRNKFTVARAMLRTVLGRYLDAAPQQVGFRYGPQGKPELQPELNSKRIRFNLSHSGDYALLAVTLDLEVGADIELHRPDFGGEEIAQRFFSARETAILCGLPEHQKVAAFFTCWTRKEAYIKALGGGLSIALDTFDVAFAPGIEPALLRVEKTPEEVERWRIYNIEAPEGYSAAVMVEGKSHELRCWEFKF